MKTKEKMKCSHCDVELIQKTENVIVSIPDCGEKVVLSSFSECPDCRVRYSTPEQMIEFARRYEEIEKHFR